MKINIYRKLIVAFFSIILPIFVLVGIITVHNMETLYKAVNRVSLISIEVLAVNSLQHNMEKILMPANDYIITGDSKYKDVFEKGAKDIEAEIKDVENLLSQHDGTPHRQEIETLKSARTALQKIKELSLRIFAIPRTAGNRDAARLMEEMDYKWGRPVTTALAGWHDAKMKELGKAVEAVERAWRRSWIIMVTGFAGLLSIGIYFTFFFSRLFVRPIRELHSGAQTIASGVLDHRVQIHTGDEIEQLADEFNLMGQRLKESYSFLEEKVRERTSELQHEKDKLISVFNAMVDGVYIVNQNYDIEYLNPVLIKEYGPIAGRKCWEYFHDRNEVCPWCPNKRVWAGETVQWEWYSFKNGKTYDLIDTPLRNLDGSISKLEIFRDITERKKAEEKIKEQLDYLIRFEKVAVKREFRMRELKERVAELEKRLGIKE